MQAIETQYKGYRFRSRLEVRWAVFFENLGLNWEYEVEGYKLESGTLYLPDFSIDVRDYTIPETPQTSPWAYNHRFYVEVKPTVVNFDPKFEQFKRELPELLPNTTLTSGGVLWTVQTVAHAMLVSGDPVEVITKHCHFTDVAFDFFLSRIRPFGDYSDVGSAALAARAARFEHGENCRGFLS